MTLIPTQVMFRGLAHSDEIESDIRERVRELEQFYAGIVRCRVAVEVPHRHRRNGRHFHIRIEITVPGGVPIVVSHEPSLHAQLKMSRRKRRTRNRRSTTCTATPAWPSTRHSLRPDGVWRTSRANNEEPSKRTQP